MTEGDRAPADEEPRRTAIVDAAYALVERGGSDALTIRAVLAATGLSRRAVYERFVGKDELMLAVFEHTIRLAAGQFRAMSASIADPIETLRAIVMGMVLGRAGTAAGHGGTASGERLGAAMSREHLRLAESHPDQLQTALAPLLDLIVGPLIEGMKIGVVRAGSADRMAALIYNLVSTTIHKELIRAGPSGPFDASRVQLAEDLWVFCRNAVAA